MYEIILAKQPRTFLKNYIVNINFGAMINIFKSLRKLYLSQIDFTPKFTEELFKPLLEH